MNFLPVCEPDVGEEEIAEVVAAIRRGEISGYFGRTIREFEEVFARYCGCKYGVAVTSGTTALHLAVAVLDLPPGSDILLSASTNIATALAAWHNGMIPVGIDSDEVSWNLDLDLIEELITDKTKGIIPVHLFGHPVDMERLNKIATRHGLYVIEDCAQSHGATCRGRMTGSFGLMGCFSFGANKIITTGEGGMIVTNDSALADRLRLLRNLAFTTPRFRHELAGFNFRMTAYQAAMGLAQVRKLESVVEAKRRVAKLYTRLLQHIPGLQLPSEPSWARHIYWMYGILVRPAFGMTRDELAANLRQQGIDTRTFFHPINSQPCFQNDSGFRVIPAPVAEMLWQRGLYLPSSHTLSETAIERVASAISKACRAVA